MNIETKEVRATTKVLDEIIKKYKEEHPEKETDWKTYEQKVAQRLKTAIRELDPLIQEAISTIKFIKEETRGRKSELTLKQKTTLLLLKQLFGKSNREMSNMLLLFSLLSEIDVSYKTVERLYSDEEVILVLHNLHILLIKKKGITQVDGCGDGTGYSLTIKKHYASEAQKLKDKLKESSGANIISQERKKALFVYSFKLLDLETRLYLSYGISFKSERDAYNKAIKLLKSLGIRLNSLRLDRYYSGQKYVKEFEQLFGKDLKLFLIPKKNATIKGPWKWKRMLFYFVNNTTEFLQEYFKRNQSESCFSEDKRRFGWRIMQRREDRIDTADFCTLLWHNLFRLA